MIGKELESDNGNKNGASTNGHRYVFDEFEIDPANRICLRRGEAVPLTGRAFDILLVFAENPGRLLRKDELLEKVWRGDFVEDGNLSRNISTLRRALGDGSKEQKYIATVQGYGYRFIAEVSKVTRDTGRVVAADVARAAQIGVIPKPAPKSLRNYRPIARVFKSGIAVAILTLVVLGVLVYYWWPGKPTSAKGSRRVISIENVKLRSLTSNGDVYASVISPDGQYLAYCSGPKLCVRHIATGNIIETAPPVRSPRSGLVHYWGIIFSADSSQIYFTIADDGDNVNGTLFRVPVLGGRAEKIISHVNSSGHESPDGQHIAFVRSDHTRGLCHLMISNTDGANEQVISTIDMNSLFGSISWSPDSARIMSAFREHTADGYIHYLAEIPVAGGPESRITQPRRERIWSAQWLPDEAGLIMSAIDPETHLSQLYYVSYPGGEERRISNDFYDYGGISIARDGHALVAQTTNVATHLWVTRKGASVPLAPVASSTAGSFQGLSWTPNGELLYSADENGLMQICRMTEDGSYSEQLTHGIGQNRNPSVTPDGRFIVFFSTRSGSNQIWRMNANGDEPMQLTHSILSVFNPQASPDGQWVYYTADVHGQWKVRKAPIAGGDEVAVEDSPVELWAVSPDGKTLAYSFFDEQQKKSRVAVRLLDSSEPFKYFDISPEMSLQWTKDGRALIYVEPSSRDANIWIQPLDGASPRPLTSLSADERIAAYAWSYDGRVLAYTRASSTFNAALIELK